MREFEYTALIEVSLVIKAKSREKADKEIEVYSAHGWVRNGELIGVSDIELIDEKEGDE